MIALFILYVPAVFLLLLEWRLEAPVETVYSRWHSSVCHIVFDYISVAGVGLFRCGGAVTPRCFKWALLNASMSPTGPIQFKLISACSHSCMWNVNSDGCIWMPPLWTFTSTREHNSSVLYTSLPLSLSLSASLSLSLSLCLSLSLSVSLSLSLSLSLSASLSLSLSLKVLV